METKSFLVILAVIAFVLRIIMDAQESKMKRVIILSGVSGTGKTFAREHSPELKDLPFVDIADIYKEWPEADWYSALFSLMGQVRKLLEEHRVVVVEGYFLKGSSSLRILLNDLKVVGAKADLRVFWETLKVCEARLIQQWEKGEQDAVQCRRRMDLLHKCWRMKGE